MNKRRNPFAETLPASRKQLLYDIFLLLLGALLQAAAYALFIAPAGIVPGGVYGISIAINHLSKGVWEAFPNGLPIGTVAYFFNLPLFLLASRKLGLSSGGKTIATFIFIGLFTDLITKYVTQGKPIIEDDPFLASVYGGAILGLGVFLTFKVGSTSAGTDVLARVLSKGNNIKTSTLIIFVDAMVILFGLLVFRDLKVPLYSLVTIVIYGKVLDLMNPENPNKAVFIVSEIPQELRDIIVTELNLRATYLHGRGMYAGTEKEIIFMIVERKYVPQLKRLVLAKDPKAFIATTNATNDTLPPLI